MAGDFDTQTAEPLIQAEFGNLSSRAPASVYPDPGSISHSGNNAF